MTEFAMPDSSSQSENNVGGQIVEAVTGDAFVKSKGPQLKEEQILRETNGSVSSSLLPVKGARNSEQTRAQPERRTYAALNAVIAEIDGLTSGPKESADLPPRVPRLIQRRQQKDSPGELLVVKDAYDPGSLSILRADTLDTRVQRQLAHSDSIGSDESPGVQFQSLDDVDLRSRSKRARDSTEEDKDLEKRDHEASAAPLFQDAVTWTLHNFSQLLHKFDDVSNDDSRQPAGRPTGGRSDGTPPLSRCASVPVAASPKHVDSWPSSQSAGTAEGAGMGIAVSRSKIVVRRPLLVTNVQSGHLSGVGYDSAQPHADVTDSRGASIKEEESDLEDGVVTLEADMAAGIRSISEGAVASVKDMESRTFHFDPVAAARKRKAARESAKVASFDEAGGVYGAGQEKNDGLEEQEMPGCGIWPWLCVSCMQKPTHRATPVT